MHSTSPRSRRQGQPSNGSWTSSLGCFDVERSAGSNEFRTGYTRVRNRRSTLGWGGRKGAGNAPGRVTSTHYTLLIGQVGRPSLPSPPPTDISGPLPQ